MGAVLGHRPISIQVSVLRRISEVADAAVLRLHVQHFVVSTVALHVMDGNMRAGDVCYLRFPPLVVQVGAASLLVDVLYLDLRAIC